MMNGYPDDLRNALIRRINGQGLRRIIRDDGNNGLWISHPDSPAQMYSITRQEFDEAWELATPAHLQGTKVLSDTRYGKDGPPVESVIMNIQDTTNLPLIEEEPMAKLGDAFAERTEDTDREALRREILEQPVTDASFSGEPVAANEMPATAFEESRAESSTDAEEAKQRADDLTDSGSFQTMEAPLAGQDGDTEQPDQAAAAQTGEEPVAGNEDPAPEEAPKRGRKAK